MKKKATDSTRQARRIARGDTVVVITGNERGKTGQGVSRTDERVVIQGVNVRKKATKRSEANPAGGFVDLEMPIQVSNVMLCDGEGKGYRAKVRTSDNGDRQIYGVVDGKEVAHRPVKSSK